MVFLSVGPRKARRRSLLVFVLLALILFAQLSVAQRTTDDQDAATTSADDATTTDAARTTDSATTTGDETTTTRSRTRDSSATTTTDSQSTSTESASSSSSSSTSNHPVVTVPPTSDAPYMQKSDTPEGTVFIAVGAALGFIGLSVLAWRGLVAWSVNRSVRQAAIAHSSETKGLLHHKRKKRSSHSHGAPPAVSLEKMNGKHRSSHSHRRSSKVPSSNSGLFFSPTAGMHSGGNRGSSYLPAGYYAAGNAAAGGGQNISFSSSDLPGMGPQSQGYSRTRSGPSPPGTPPPHPAGGAHESQHHNGRQSYVGASTSSVNLSSPQHGRTPSAYLEDLFENHPPQRRP
ncbi:hypothetical protein P170DRAFT_346633 [Aspergillus steynii IBT 23096]|uniref:Transmembrane protein n=1 Tax=Aspergillus steynii IBT 23096 TaxID=1392250 RepID=A0A2I2GMY6_9EURO|nr:uncharacterized protein P170DRAFT_346633 [Aspergillus steynii IBT 23096]PLB54247.1 hypothetical protein P170DRAFT_346633 [Aspergillus steynii IBT 23096]